MTIQRPSDPYCMQVSLMKAAKIDEMFRCDIVIDFFTDVVQKRL